MRKLIKFTLIISSLCSAIIASFSTIVFSLSCVACDMRANTSFVGVSSNPYLLPINYQNLKD